jgi:hypothetical protein
MTTYDNDGNEVQKGSTLARYERPLYVEKQWVVIRLFGIHLPVQIDGVSRNTYKNEWQYSVDAPQAEHSIVIYSINESDILALWEGEPPVKPVKTSDGTWV